jgi:hypothetical protein
MKANYSYDVAISAAGYDAVTAQRLAERLRSRLALPVFNTWEHHGTVVGDGRMRLAARVLRREARVVVVLYQRLWGATPSTQFEEDVLARRMACEGTEFLRVIALEEAEPPRWMSAAVRESDDTDGSLDSTVEAIVAAVVSAGGTARTETPADAEARAAHEAVLDRERGFFFRSPGGTSASTREFATLVDEVERELSERCPPQLAQTYRAPDRLIVQLGDAGLSVSRMRAPTGVAAEASLLVIEWNGTITQPGSSRPRGERATPLREHVLRANAGKTTTWLWCDADGGQRVYTSRDLAAQCVHLLLRQVGDSPAPAHVAVTTH